MSEERKLDDPPAATAFIIHDSRKSALVLYLLGDMTAGPAYRFTQWLELVRKRSGKYRPSGFPSRSALTTSFSLPGSMADTEHLFVPEQATEISLWERLGRTVSMDIESTSFSWNMLSSLHHTEHGSSIENSEDDMNKALEVTVNSGGVVFFALFNLHVAGGTSKEAAAVIKIASSRMATQSERLGYEFAKWLGVQTPQARIIHSSSSEWLQIKEAAERARDAANVGGDEAGEVTCSELLEALELSRCIFLMNYVHGCPLLETSNAFHTEEAAERTAAALGRILMLDLVIRNEDRLPSRQLRWRGNNANLLISDKMASENKDTLKEAFDSAIKRYQPNVIRALQKDRRATSVDSRLIQLKGVDSKNLIHPDAIESPASGDMSLRIQESHGKKSSNFHIVAIDSGVPRRPPAGKRAQDQAMYPKLVELLLNSSEYSSHLLHDITGGRLGAPLPECVAKDLTVMQKSSSVSEFRKGFRSALRDLQGFHIFLITLHQKLDGLLLSFMNIANRNPSEYFDKDDVMVPESLVNFEEIGLTSPSPPSKEERSCNNQLDINDLDLQKTGIKSSGYKENGEAGSPNSREAYLGKFCKENGDPTRSVHLTAKLRDFHKFAKGDVELNKEMDQWDDMLRTEVVKLCHDNNFNSGFFEACGSKNIVDVYELKVRLEHILERISLISDAGNTERPALITGGIFIGGALAARSMHTLQLLGVTHILCLCSNEIGQSDSQHPEVFEYINFSISDSEDTDISCIFAEACDFIDYVEQAGGRVLVHCFEGRSRSATLVLAYLMLRKRFTLLDAWNMLKRVHRRAQPNDGFAKILVELDRKLHGKVSMEWKQRKPVMKVCSICGKDAGLSNSSLKLHLQKAHKKLSSGSVDSAMTLEIQKAWTALSISRGGSVSPPPRRSRSILDD
uniref:Dual specificity protein phosphatase PHS1 n=1 Tax=Kalanchoe fedtschenkoi TaxID=63787 RepID=A0A7N0SX39_KALFE